MLKSFTEMRKVDISQYTKTRDGMEYLNWAKCIDLLYQNGANKVYFEPLVNENGSSLFMCDKSFKDQNDNTNSCYEVAVKITIDDDEFVIREPLMNGKNPVKDNSLTQQRVGNAQKRAFVKGVAIRTGLGFNLWCKEEEDEADDDLSKHSLRAIRERMLQKVTWLMSQKEMTEDEIAKANNMEVDEMKALFSQFKSLSKFEKTLNELMKK